MIWTCQSCLCLTMLDEFLVNVIALPNDFGKKTKQNSSLIKAEIKSNFCETK